MKSLRMALRFAHEERNSVSTDKSSRFFSLPALSTNLLLKQR